MSNGDTTLAELGAITLRAPSIPAVEFAQALSGPVRAAGVFAEDRVAALDRLARRIFEHPLLRKDPAAAALAFWLRRAHLAELKADWESRAAPGVMWVPAGTVFHLAPSNVDTMFVYSWALAYLAGNQNVVRLSSTSTVLVDTLLELIRADGASNPGAWQGNWFLSYGHDDAVTAWLSARCDHRIVWGGDETVRRIRSVPLAAHASERAFASKFSLSVIQAEALTAADDPTWQRLAAALTNDIVAFDQKACSSPHLIVWLGGSDVPAMARRLDAAVAAELRQRGTAGDVGLAVHRIEQGFLLAADGVGEHYEFQPGLATAIIPRDTTSERLELGGGFLLHASFASLDELAGRIDRRTQTIGHFGFRADELIGLARVVGTRGADRIVPVGKALDFSPRWDGFDLWSDVMRAVVVSG